MKRYLTIVLFALGVCSCSNTRKLESIRRDSVAVNLAMTPKPGTSPYEVPLDSPAGDTLVVKGADGRDIFILKAVRDEVTGEMVANDVLEAAFVTATFRNVAERDGRVGLEFRITVPQMLLDSKWQIRFTPTLLLPSGPRELERIIITGKEYRRSQLLGYERFNRFLGTIITDSTYFIDQVMVGRFLERYPLFSVPESEAVEHYTDHLSIRLNEARKARRPEMYSRYVKVPIDNDGVRLDTIISEPDGAFIYDYRQLLETSPGLRKVAVAITGGLWDGNQKIYSIPMEDSITFYISSLSTLVESRERYLKEIISRRVTANSSYGITFRIGSAEIRQEMGSNASEMERIKENVREILGEGEFELDSIVIAAASSPEGPFSLNKRLSQARSDKMAWWLKNELQEDGAGVRLVARSLPEDWLGLLAGVERDISLSEREKGLFAQRMKIVDPDRREATMRSDSYYQHMRDSLYPGLRRVRMDFHMHRRGMMQDTVETTVPDTLYSAGVRALKDGDYLKAAGLLASYRDYNYALACCSLNKNHTALEILEGLPLSPNVHYLMAIIYARLADEQKAVQNYLLACAGAPGFIHRGNLDPEISSLIRKYNLNQ